jgi:hypothetical protein
MKAKYLHIVIALFFSACTSSDTWHGVVYPNQKNLGDALQIGSFDTLQECGITALKVLDRLHALERGDYECGKNCRKDSFTPSFMVCEETMTANIRIKLAQAYYPRENLSHSLEKFYIFQIHKTYKPEYLTYPGMIKAWYARKAISFKVPISNDLRDFAKAQEEFADNVRGLGIVTESVVPTLALSPIEFEGSFYRLAKRKSLNLKLRHD